jgi:hypothetical protein
MDKPDFLYGHESLGHRPNVRVELKRVRRDPLEKLLSAIDPDPIRIVSNDTTRYRDAYYFYYLSLDRYLREMSIAARFSVAGLRHVRKYSSTERKLAVQYRQVAPFLEYDLINCLLHGRILLDRVAALSRSFIQGKHLSSFTSFSDHKKFFMKLTQPYGAHEAYAEYIRNETSWFEMPLKEVRDKFLVHSSPKHMRFLGYASGSDYELLLNILLPDSADPAKPLAKVKMITISPLRLSYDIERFLKWFCKYGIAQPAR